MRFYLRALLMLPLITLLNACTDNQQDKLLQMVTELGRNKAKVSEHLVQADDIRVSYLERQGDGPTVLLVHGFSANKDTWLSFIAKLPRDWHIVAPDLAGHGDSSNATDGNYQLTRQSERLYAFSQAINLPAHHIIGSSMGGGIAALYAAHYPHAVKTLALMDAAGIDGENSSDFMRSLEQGNNLLIATDKKSFEQRWQLVMNKPPFVPWPLRPAMVRLTLERADINRTIFAGMMATREYLSQQQLGELLKERVTMPTLIMWGEKDRVLDVSAAHAFNDYLAQAELVIFPNIGHLPQIEIPKRSADRYTLFVLSN